MLPYERERLLLKDIPSNTYLSYFKCYLCGRIKQQTNKKKSPETKANNPGSELTK